MVDNSHSTERHLRVTIVSHIFHPDELGGAALMTDLAKFLKETGHDVNIVSTFPYYPRWKLAPEDKGVWRRNEQFEGMPLRRLRMYIPQNASTAKRLLSDVSFFFSVILLGRRMWKNAEVIVTTCPMFGQTTAMRFATPFRRVPKLIIVQDFVVDAAVELGMIKNKFLGRVLKRIERWAFRSGSTLTSISEEMHSKLKAIVGEDRRTLLIPNWIHGSLERAIARRKAKGESTRATQMLFYSGNVGRKQGLPDFLSGFDGEKSGWRIQINGSGAEFDHLKQVCLNRSDIDLHGLQEEDGYIDTLLTCSACLVTQKPGVGANFLPSKILPALATGSPILAVCEAHSPLGREVISAKCGEVIEPGDKTALENALRRWIENPDILKEYSRNSLSRSRIYSRDVVLKRYADEIALLANGPTALAQKSKPASETLVSA